MVSGPAMQEAGRPQVAGACCINDVADRHCLDLDNFILICNMGAFGTDFDSSYVTVLSKFFCHFRVGIFQPGKCGGLRFIGKYYIDIIAQYFFQ